MKRIIRISFSLAAVVLLGTSCSKTFLDTNPNYLKPTSEVFSDIAGAEGAINGLCRLMTSEYGDLDGGSGEGAILNYYGNYPGNDFQKCNRTGMNGVMSGSYHMLLDSAYDYYPWHYYFMIIMNANQILANIDNIDGKGVNIDAQKDFIKAQALVFRSYSFFRLSELYCNRWEDAKKADNTYTYTDIKGDEHTFSGEGAVRGLPLRLDLSTGDIPCSALIEVKDQIYKDLDEAIEKFTLSGLQRKSDEYFKPDKRVAYAIYARAALTYQDWPTAAKYARLARENMELMSNDEYLNGGFNSANCETIWGTYDAIDQNLSSRSFFNYMASNGSSLNCRTYPAAISKQLYDQIPVGDIRRQLFLEPTPEEVMDSKFDKTTGRSTGILAERAKKQYKEKLYWDTQNDILMSNIYMYMQFKFQCTHLPGVGSVIFFRTAEMMLIEAEALCMMGSDEGQIRAILKELNQKRNPNYNCDGLAGDNLKNEIFLYWRIELWGEGFDWYLYKRLNQTINRVSITSGGSFHDTFCYVIKPGARNKWTWVIPRKETDYNKLIKAEGETDEEIVDE